MLLALLLAASQLLECNANNAKPRRAWTETGAGTAGAIARAANGDGGSVLVLFGGYKAKPAWVRIWSEQVAEEIGASEALSALHFGTLIAVPGPATSGYVKGETEVPTAALLKLLASLSPKLVVFAAHSSGAAVAARTIAKAPAALAKRIVYLQLDGGGVAPRAEVAAWGCVSARCAKARSQNAGAMANCGAHAFRVAAGPSDPKDSCKSDWCCHDFLINKVPHDPAAYCLGVDYTTFDARHPVNIDWLKNPAMLAAMKKLAQ